MATFKPFQHHTVELKRKGKNTNGEALVSVIIDIKRHTGKVDTYGLTVLANGRKVTEDKYSLYYEVRDKLEEKGFNLDHIYF